MQHTCFNIKKREMPKYPLFPHGMDDYINSIWPWISSVGKGVSGQDRGSMPLVAARVCCEGFCSNVYRTIASWHALAPFHVYQSNAYPYLRDCAST